MESVGQLQGQCEGEEGEGKDKRLLESSCLSPVVRPHPIYIAYSADIDIK